MRVQNTGQQRHGKHRGSKVHPRVEEVRPSDVRFKIRGEPPTKMNRELPIMISHWGNAEPADANFYAELYARAALRVARIVSR